MAWDKVDQVVLVLAEVVEGKEGLPRDLDQLKRSTSEAIQDVHLFQVFQVVFSRSRF